MSELPLAESQMNSSEASNKAIARDAENFIQLLQKGIKNIGIYLHAEERYGDFLAPAFHALELFLEDNGSLPLKLGPYALYFKQIAVYEDEDRENLTYKFYKDGMRYLIFRPGISLEELLRFVLLAMGRYSEHALFHEDMVTRFWKEDFQFIDHVVVEGFGFGDLSEEEVQIEVERIIGYLRTQLAAQTDDITRFARLSLQDLELELSDIEQVRGGIVSGRPAKDSDRAKVQDDLILEEKTRLFAKMVLILFQVLELEAEPDDREMLMEAMTQVLDLLLVSEDIRGAVALLHRFDMIEGRRLAPERKTMVQSMKQELRRRMMEPQRISQVGQHLQLSKDVNEKAVKTYLMLCGDEEILVLVDMLAGMERPSARNLLIDVLVKVGRHNVEVFARRLDHNASTVVKDMLTIIYKIDPPNKVDLVARCLEHPNIMIRLEGLKTLAQVGGATSLKYIERALNDEDIQMRLGAMRALATRSPKRATPLFIQMMQASGFLQREGRERTTIATALGETRSPEALEYLASLFRLKIGLFNRSNVYDMKMLAVVGLQAMRNLAAFRVLNAEVQNRAHNLEVLQACHRAALRLKEHIEKERAEHGG